MKPMKITIFSGGTGSGRMKEGLKKYLPDAEIDNWINLCDAGKSTGVVAEITQTLGVSDARKNLSLYYSIKHKENVNKNYMSFMEGRYALGGSADEARGNTLKLLKEWNIAEGFIGYANKFFDMANKCGYAGKFEDFNIANIVMGTSFAEQGIDKTIDMIKDILEIPECNIIVPWHNYNKIYARTKSGVVLDNEGKIVDWANPNDKIDEVYFVDGKTGKETREYELYDESYTKRLDESDLIVLSTGTQWSSLIPSYMNKQVKAAIEKNAEKVILCMNNKQDKDMYGVDYKEMLSIIGKYLDIEKFKILYNQDSDKGMHPDKAEYMFPFGNDEKGRSDSDKFAKAILCTYYGLTQERCKYKKIFDFDDTLYGRKDEDKDVSLENLGLVEDMAERGENIAVISGNTRESIESRARGRLGKCTVYTNYGLLKNKPNGENEYFDKENYLTAADKDRIMEIVGLGNAEVRGDKNVITSVAFRSVKEDRKKIVAELNGKLRPLGYRAAVTGTATIEVLKAGASKMLALESETTAAGDFNYFDDEPEGNAEEIYKSAPKNFVKIENPREMNLILKITEREA